MASVAYSDDLETNELARIASLLGGRATFKSEFASQLIVHELILGGFPALALTTLVRQVDLLKRPEFFERAVGVSVRTLQRRKGEAVPRTLSPELSGRAWKFAEILAKATEIFGSQEEAERWLERPALGLNNNRPIDLLSTLAGVELVEAHIERIEYGAYE
ncbi:antitoxin [Sphingomonas sp. HMWF008]|nr:antitoxin [Sphingomonas sp. HMWF008]